MRKTRKLFLVLWISTVLITSSLHANVKLPAIFNDHMVLQQKSFVNVWGTADPGEKVFVKPTWKNELGKTVTADKNGNWQTKLRTPKAGGPFALTIKGNNEITLNDILIGEVWICSGQSNMEFFMSWLNSDRIREDITKANYPNIRLFTVKKTISTKPLDDVTGNWQPCSPNAVKNFSAVAYYFGKNLNEKLDIPIGLISTNWGGTVSQAWTSADALKPYNQFKEQLDLVADPDKYKTKMQAQMNRRLTGWNNQIKATDPGTQNNWALPTLNDSEWKTTNLDLWSANPELTDVDGIVWYRKTVTIPDNLAAKDLKITLGKIDDIDTTYFNGDLISSTGGWTVDRSYTIPANLVKAGKNTIAIRVADTSGEGGFQGDGNTFTIQLPGDNSSRILIRDGWKYKLSYSGQLPKFPNVNASINQNTATVLYNGMIAPLIKFRIAGAIWYQGESNRMDPYLYRDIFPAMIKNWREKWNQGDFQFIFVQIAPYIYDKNMNSAYLREAQLLALKTKNTGMAVTMDIGEERDIHPKNKHDVGDRLARWALAKTYGKKDLAYSGPLYNGKMKKEGNKIRIYFDYADGLNVKGGDVKDFTIAGDDKVFHPATAVIDGDTIVVSSPNVKNPVAVRYAWSNWVKTNLYNKAGLPASSFRTDDWPIK